MKVLIFWTKLSIIAHGALPCLVFSLSLSPEPTYRRRAGRRQSLHNQQERPAGLCAPSQRRGHQACCHALRYGYNSVLPRKPPWKKKRMKERKKGLRPHPPTQLMATVPTPHGLFCLGRKIVEMFSRFPCLQNGLMFIVLWRMICWPEVAKAIWPLWINDTTAALVQIVAT